jgi:hypothetical protein
MKTQKGYVLRDLGSEYVLVAEGAGAVDFTRMISMNASAAFLWEQVEGKDFDSNTLASLLMEQYGISRETADQDAAHLLQNWKDANLIDE